MNNILIAGGTGLVGSKLVKKLKQKNYNIVFLSTRLEAKTLKDRYYWNPDKGIFPEIDLSKFDCCINLCGAGIFDKNFTTERKAYLLESRVKPIELLLKHFQIQNVKLPVFMSASASGYYDNICLNGINEASTHGSGFISELVQSWEAAAQSMQAVSDRVAIVRIGIVMAENGGFLAPLKKSINAFAGAVPGSGKQLVSWIHIDDLCDAFIFILENGHSGIFNGTAPTPESMEQITKLIAKQLHRPLFLPNIPVWALKIIFGKERHKLLLTDQNIAPYRLMYAGFKFQYNSAQEAISNLIP
jgi:uncharacterized protein (TIGR01777 family)